MYLIQLWSLKKLINKKDTGKFWSFKDTKNYKNVKTLPHNRNTVRTFIFEKSFLLEISIDRDRDGFTNNKTVNYVVPLCYTSNGFPNGFYTATGCDKTLIRFTDYNIVKVVE